MLEIRNLDCFDEIKQGKGMERTEEVITIENGDEYIEIHMRTVYHDSRNKKDIMHEWIKRRQIYEFMRFTIGVNVYVYKDGDCHEKYNPTVYPDCPIALNFNWMLPDTAAHREGMLDEIKYRIAEGR